MVLWVVKPYTFVGGYQHFGLICSLLEAKPESGGSLHFLVEVYHNPQDHNLNNHRHENLFPLHTNI
jgi:hypothetical protein